MKRILFSLFIIGTSVALYLNRTNITPITKTISDTLSESLPSTTAPNSRKAAVKEAEVPELPKKKILDTNYHIFQTFNNCGPASLSMALSHFGIRISQQQLGQQLRPYQHPTGDNDDKSVSLKELEIKAKELGMAAYNRPAGDIALLKAFIANDMPVITRTWLKVDEDIGHYRVVRGYDDTKRELIQDDSLQGKNIRFTYDEFNAIWQKLNYEYLVLVPSNKVKVAETILGENLDEKTSWEKAVKVAKEALQKNPSDASAGLNLSVALYQTGKYQDAVKEFEKVENRLVKRALWYQPEPIFAYYKLGNYDRVFSTSALILANGNRAYSEMYYVRGLAYQKTGQKDLAEFSFEKAEFYNTNLDFKKVYGVF